LNRSVRGAEICAEVAARLSEIENRGKPLNQAMSVIAGSRAAAREH
jgi:hypothetical protein